MSNLMSTGFVGLRILCFVGYFLPGYRSGGSMRTVANFVEHFGDEFKIYIVTRDRDALDEIPYPTVEVDRWSIVGKASVFYASQQSLTLQGIGRLLSDCQYDVLYLNSYFDFSFTVLPLLARRLGLAPKCPCVIAPRGELSSGAISIKPRKKRLYLMTARALGLYQHLEWQASSELEAHDIRRKLGFDARDITVAPDLFPRLVAERYDHSEQQIRAPGSFRICFLSRISRVKNLDFLLRALRRVIQPVKLTIFGPVEDKEYWSICKTIIDGLPANVQVNYAGEVLPDRVYDVFSKYDLFALPTRGENFGHVILESLTAGTPVLTSDQTPWQPDSVGGITTLTLTESDPWAEEISRWAVLDEFTLSVRRKAAKSIAEEILSKKCAIVKQNRDLFVNTVARANKIMNQ